MNGTIFSPPRAAGPQIRQAGFGLIEIMVAMTIGLLMLGGVLSLVFWISVARTELDKTSEQIENGRFALQVLSDEIRTASFYGASQVSASDYKAPGPCSMKLDDLGFDYQDGTATLPVGVQGYAAVDTATASCLKNVSAGKEALTVRSVDTTSVSVAAATDGAPYMQLSQCQTDMQPMLFGTKGGGANFDLRDKDCAAVSELWRHLSRTYYLADCDLCDAKDGIPTLKVAKLVVEGGNLTIRTSSVVEGIEDVHFEYGMDLVGGDGAPDCYAPDPTANVASGTACDGMSGWSDDDATNWSNVVSVRINLLARSTQPSAGWIDNKLYDLGRVSMGEADPEGPFEDQYKRQVYSAVVTLPNVSGVREW